MKEACYQYQHLMQRLAQAKVGIDATKPQEVVEEQDCAVSLGSETGSTETEELRPEEAMKGQTAVVVEVSFQSLVQDFRVLIHDVEDLLVSNCLGCFVKELAVELNGTNVYENEHEDLNQIGQA
jgi:hypothetical protein